MIVTHALSQVLKFVKMFVQIGSQTLLERYNFERAKLVEILDIRDQHVVNGDPRTVDELLDDNFDTHAPIIPQHTKDELEKPIEVESDNGETVRKIRRKPKRRTYTNQDGVDAPLGVNREKIAMALYDKAKAEYGYLTDRPANRQIVRNYLNQWFKRRKDKYRDIREKDFHIIAGYVVTLFFIPNDYEIMQRRVEVTEEAMLKRYQFDNRTNVFQNFIMHWMLKAGFTYESPKPGDA